MSGNKFKVVPEGYDIYEVHKFLKVVTTEFEKIVKRNTELETKVSELNEVIVTLENETNCVDKVKAEIESFIESRKQIKVNLENEISILEDKIKDYNDKLNELYYNHVELINNLK